MGHRDQLDIDGGSGKKRIAILPAYTSIRDRPPTIRHIRV